MSMHILNKYCFFELMKADSPIAPTTYVKELSLHIKKKLTKMFGIGHDAAENYLVNDCTYV